MNIALVLRDAWRITWKNPALWALALLMFLAFLPAGLLSLSFSTAAGALSSPASLTRLWPEFAGFVARLRQVSGAVWAGLALAALVLLVLTTSITLVLQAAALRGVVMAAETGRTSLRQALQLGRQRTINIVKLSALFGLITAALGILPSVALLLIGDRSSLGAALVRLAEQGLTPVTWALNIVALLALMSIALEDFSPRAAFGRAGNVFKSGWWAFIIVFAFSVLAPVVALLIFIVPPFLAMPVAFFNPSAGIWMTLGAFICSGLLGGFLFLFSAVYVSALYALVYREAARRTAVSVK